MGIPKVDTGEKHHHLPPADPARFLFAVRPWESAVFHPFLTQAESVTVPPEAFEQPSVPAASASS